MSCLDCKNCKQGTSAYFCPDKNDFVIHEVHSEEKMDHKVRSGWKKGNKNYENHRRKSRKETAEL